MSRWLALAVGGEIETQTPPDSMTEPDKTPADKPKHEFCQVLSNCQVEPEHSKPHAMKQLGDQEFRHGFTASGRPRTWTGKVVSLNEWRGLSEWERNGPNAQHWNSITQSWETPK